MFQNVSRLRPRYAICAILLLLAARSPTVAQSPVHSKFVVALENSLLSNGNHVVIRTRARENPSIVVLIDSTTTPRQLLLAVVTVGGMRARNGDSLVVDGETVPNGRLSQTSDLQKQLAQMTSLIGAVRRAPIEDVLGIGSVRVLELDLGMRPRLGR